MSVATGAPDLLYILLERARRLVVHDVANVGFVDAHAKGARCDHDEAPGALHEVMLCRRPIGSTHLAVIARDRDMGAPQGIGELIDRGGRGAVDNARTSQPLDTPASGTELLRTGHDVYRQTKVLAVSRSDNHDGVVQVQPICNVPADTRRRGCGEGECRRVAQPLPGGTQPQVGWAKIVPPFRNAVRFVDAEECRPSA